MYAFNMIAHAKFHSNGLMTVQHTQDYANLIFGIHCE